MSVGPTNSRQFSVSRPSPLGAGAPRPVLTSGEKGQVSLDTKSLKTGASAPKNKPVDGFGPVSYRLADNAPVKQARVNDPAAGGTSNMNIDKAVAHLNAHALAKSKGECAKYVRLAIEVGGGVKLTRPNPVPAKDYGPYLSRNGFRAVSAQNYVPRKGDVVVIQPYKGGNPNGHITMYNGSQWVSDFRQRDMWGGSDYRKYQPPYAIYRP